MHGLDTYVAEPPSNAQPKGIIVIIPDGFGWQFVNNRILADHYAQKGQYKVYLPEFMDGGAAPTWLIDTIAEMTYTGSIWAWLTKPYHIAMTLYGFAPFIWMSKTGRAEPLLHSFFTSLRANEGSQLPLGVAGFCWGGKHAIDLTHAPKDGSKPLVDTCFVAHPSNLILPVDIEKVSRPLSVAIGDKDFVLREAGRKQVKGILKERENVRSEFVLYPGAGHGFSIRADPKNEKQAEQAAEAEDQAINWFNSMS